MSKGLESQGKGGTEALIRLMAPGISWAEPWGLALGSKFYREENLGSEKNEETELGAPGDRGGRSSPGWQRADGLTRSVVLV